MAVPACDHARAAASANAGKRGSRYCGSLDWFNVKKASGPSTQQASSSGSPASARSKGKWLRAGSASSTTAGQYGGSFPSSDVAVSLAGRRNGGTQGSAARRGGTREG